MKSNELATQMNEEALEVISNENNNDYTVNINIKKIQKLEKIYYLFIN